MAALFDHALDIAQAYLAELDGAATELRPYPGLHAVAQSQDQSLWDVAGRCINDSHVDGAAVAPQPKQRNVAARHAFGRMAPFAFGDDEPRPTAVLVRQS